MPSFASVTSSLESRADTLLRLRQIRQQLDELRKALG